MIGDKPTRNLQWSDAQGRLTVWALQFLGKISGRTEADYTTDLGGVFVPVGGIIMWSGTVADIPDNWQICDGTNNTPDLTGLFVVHADADSGGTYNVGDTGGANSVTLTVDQIPSHSHQISANNAQNTRDNLTANRLTGLRDGTTGDESSVTTFTGGGSSHENRPPYYALAYIMRVS